MKTIGDLLALRLQAGYLKPLGFKKTRHTFMRPCEGFAERYQIQGSAWNSRDTPWTCYLNCGISFDGLPARDPDRDFPRTHAWMRSDVFVENARPQYEVTTENLEAMVVEIADVISRCSAYFQRRNLVLRECYENNRYKHGFLADPELVR